MLKKGSSLFETLISSFSVTNKIIFGNVALFFVFMVIFAINPTLLPYFALQAGKILSGENIWTLFTAMFLHQGFFHLFANMFSLFFIGNLTEKIIGKKRFLVFYLIAGVVASLFFVGLAQFGTMYYWGENVFGGVNDLAVGASGAIFGILGLLVMLLPRYRIYLIVGPLIILAIQGVLYGVLSQKALFAVDLVANLAIILMIFAMFSPNQKFRKMAVPIEMKMWVLPFIAIIPLFIVSIFIKLPIGNSAHLGGLLVGLSYGAYLRLKYKRKIVMLERFFR